MNEKLQFALGFIAGCITCFMIFFLFLPKILPKEPRSIATKAAKQPDTKKIEKKRTSRVEFQKRYGRYKKIDFHQHLHHSANMNHYFQAMKLFNVEKSVALALRDTKNNSVYRENNDFLLKLQKEHPSKIIAFSTIQEEDSRSADIFEEDIIRGSRGLKLIGWHIAYIRKYNFSLTSKEMYRLYGLCDERGLPLLIHIRLPHNEKYYDELAKILSDFKNLKIILAHAGVALDNLTKLDLLMEEFPNLYVDLSFYGTYHEYTFKHVGRNRHSFRDLILRHQEQILWGTDVYPTRQRGYYYMMDALRCSTDLVEEETFICPSFKKKDRLWGLDLPGRVLEKIYYRNARNLLNLRQ